MQIPAEFFLWLPDVCFYSTLLVLSLDIHTVMPVAEWFKLSVSSPELLAML